MFRGLQASSTKHLLCKTAAGADIRSVLDAEYSAQVHISVKYVVFAMKLAKQKMRHVVQK